MPSTTAALRPLAETELSDKAIETLGRVRELFGEEAVPEAFFVYANAPAFMHDFYMNFKRFVLTAGKLDLKTKLLVAYGASIVLDAKPWRDVLARRLESAGATETELSAAAAIAATCSMYNVFFKFRDLAGSPSFQTMPVGLRAFAFANSGLDEKTVEIINVAVSDLNGCKPCTSGHVAKAVALGVSEEALLEAVQAAAAVAAGAVFLRAGA
jgi:alkyl hydroperoxide reductase subunit D